MKVHWGFGLALSLFVLPSSVAQESREAYLIGLRAAVKNPADSQDVYRRLIQPEFREILTEAAKKGEQVLVAEMLSAYFGGNRAQDTALGLAVAFGDTTIVKALLEHGADTKASNEQQCTPLHSAADDDGHAEILKMLLKKGADPNARSFVGTTPLMLAAGNDAKRNVISLLLADAKVNARNNDGETPLVLAVKSNGLETVRILLEAGANPRLKDDAGKTVFDFIVPNEHFPLMNRMPIGRLLTDEHLKEIEQEQRDARKQITELLKRAKTPAIHALAVSKDGKLLISGDLNGEVQIWDTATGKRLQTLIPNVKIITLTLSQDGKQLVVGCERRDIQIWEKQGSQFRLKHTLPSQSVPAKAFAADDKSLDIWKSLKGEPKQNIASQDFTCLTVLPNNHALVTGNQQGEITLWNVKTGTTLFRTRLFVSPIGAICAVPNTSWIAVSSDDGSLLFWDTTTKTSKQTLIKSVPPS